MFYIMNNKVLKEKRRSDKHSVDNGRKTLKIYVI